MLRIAARRRIRGLRATLLEMDDDDDQSTPGAFATLAARSREGDRNADGREVLRDLAMHRSTSSGRFADRPTASIELVRLETVSRQQHDPCSLELGSRAERAGAFPYFPRLGNAIVTFGTRH